MPIRPLVPDDVEAVADAHFTAFHALALRHGLAPAFAAVRESRLHLRRLLEADPVGGFVAEEAGRVVGHAWVHVRGPIATVGPVAVEPAAQGRGIGRALLEQAIAAAGPRAMQIRVVQESFDLRSLRLCLGAGFRIVAPLLALELDPDVAVPAPSVPARTTVALAGDDDVQRIVARDARAFGTRRPADVERRVRDGVGVTAERGGKLAGYALGVAGSLGAAAAEDPELTLALLATLAGERRLRGGALRTIVGAGDRVLVDGLLALGFRPFRACHYMIRGGGTAPPSGYVLLGADYC